MFRCSEGRAGRGGESTCAATFARLAALQTGVGFDKYRRSLSNVFQPHKLLIMCTLNSNFKLRISWRILTPIHQVLAVTHHALLRCCVVFPLSPFLAPLYITVYSLFSCPKVRLISLLRGFLSLADAGREAILELGCG